MISSLNYFFSHHQFKKNPLKTLFRLVVWEVYYKLFDRTAIVTFYEELKIELHPMKHRGISGLIYIFRQFEEEEIFLTNYIKQGMVVLDIGANIGYYSLIFSKLIGEKGRVYSFEPTKCTYKELLKNIEINHCKNIVPLNHALSDKNEKRKFYHADDHGRNAFAPEIENAIFEEVECKMLDQIIEENNLKIDLVKIDVEGAELLVFKGGSKFLNQFNGPIYCEFNTPKIKNMGYALKDLVLLINEMGFDIYQYTDDEKKLKAISNPEQFNGDVILIKNGQNLII